MKFEFTQQEADIIIQSLAKQPFEVVYKLIAKMQQQAAKQLQPKLKKEQKNAGTLC